MRKLFLPVAAVFCATLLWGNPASADNYNERRPRVSVQSFVVISGNGIDTSARYFCPGQPLTFTLKGPGGTFTSPNVIPGQPTGAATFTFSTAHLRPGKYTITAKQRPSNGPGDCWRRAITKVLIKKHSCQPTLAETFGSSGCDDDDSSNSIGPGSVASGGDPDVVSSGVAAGEFLTSYQRYGITPPVLGAELTADPSATGDAILPVTGSNSAPVTQVATVTIAAGLAMMVVAGFRRRSNTSVRPVP